jgi:thiol-disulfide isomerase/thioredoxin
MTLSQTPARHFRSQGRSFPMFCFVRTSLTTIGLTSIALAALAGGRAQSADTDLQPALQQIRDEVRDLRHDVKVLRELLEKKSPPAAPPQTTEKQSGSTAPLADGAYYIYSRSDSESQLLTPLIDHLRGQGYPITKIDIAQDLKQKYGVDPDPISFHPLLILKQPNGLTALRGLNREDTVRSIVGKFFAPPDPSNAPEKVSHWNVIITPRDPPAAAIPDRKVVQIKNYIESFAGDSGKKMTGNEMIASVDGQPVLASEIFQRAWTEPLTPDGTSLATATKALAAGQIEESSFRQLQLLALRKFSQNYLNTRGWAQAMIASLGKAEREKAENAITDEFNKYVENLKRDFKVATAFDVNKKLREQGTSLLSLKAEFRDHLLADEFVRGAAKGKEEPAAKASPMVGHPDDRPTYAYFFYSKNSPPCQQMLPIIGRLQAEGHRIIKVDVDARMTGEQTRFKVKAVPTLWINAGDQGIPLSGIQTEEEIRQALKHFGDWRPAEPARKRPESHAVVPQLDRHVTIDCDNLPLSEVLEQIFRERPKIEFRYEQPFSTFHYPYFHFPGSESDAKRSAQKLLEAHEAANLDARCPQHVTLHVADVPVSVALQRIFDQLHLRYEFENGSLRIEFPADKKLREALQRRMNFDCEKLSLRQFIDHMWKDWHLGNVVVSMTVNLQAPITMHVKEVTLESVLKQGFQQAGVRCEFQDEMFLLAPADPLVFLAYPVADLLLASQPQSGAVRDEKIDFNSLEKLIRTAAEPKSWEGAGGEGRIQHVDKTLSLVIGQTQPVHEQIQHLLQELRKPQGLKITLRTILLQQHAAELIDPAGINAPAEHGGSATLLAKDRCDFLVRLATDASRLSPLATVAADVGKEMLVHPFPGKHVWPESIQAISGQIGSRAYIWFELTGNDPTTGQPHREGVMSLAPEFKPVLVRLKRAPEAYHEPAFWGPSHTVDQVIGKPPEPRFLLIKPVIEFTDPTKEGPREETERRN